MYPVHKEAQLVAVAENHPIIIHALVLGSFLESCTVLAIPVY